MNIKFLVAASAIVALSLVNTGCKKKNQPSEAELQRQYTDRRFTEIDSRLSELNSKVDAAPVAQPSTSPVVITDVGQAPAPERRPRAAAYSQDVPSYTPTRSARSSSGKSGGKAIAVSGVNPRDVQKALNHAGFNPGKVDGKVGPNTVRAIKQFQSAEGLKADGVVGPRTWERLRKHL